MNVKTLCMALLATGVFSFQSLSAQNACNSQKKCCNKGQNIESLVTIAGKQLQLDEATTAKFAPIYREYLKALSAEKKCSGSCKKSESQTEKTDAMIDQRMKEQFLRQKNRLALNEKYYQEFRKVLTARQTQKLFQITNHHGKPACHNKKNGQNADNAKKCNACKKAKQQK